MKKLTKIGFALTAVWLIIFGIILRNSWPDAVEMGLNEWGDFLAGLTAPLALLWLVIGYFLQSEELSLNTKALKAQQEELRRQVEETALLAKNSDRQAQAAERAVELSTQERKAHEHDDLLRRRIKLKLIEGVNSSQGTARTACQNVGESVTRLSITDAASDVRGRPTEVLHAGETLRLSWPAGLPRPMRFSIDYTDSAGRRRREKLQITDKSELASLGETAVTALALQ